MKNIDVTEIPAEIHELPALGEIEYIFDRKQNKLTIAVEGVTVKKITGAEALDIISKIRDDKSVLNPYEILIDRKSLAVFGLGIEQLRISTRRLEIKEPRQVAMRWLEMNTKLSQAKIAALMGGFDHATVINARNRINALICYDMDLRKKVEEFNKA